MADDTSTTGESAASDARVAAFVAFYYRPYTMAFLNRTLRNLSDFGVSRMHVTVLTNLRDAAVVDNLCRRYGDDYEVLTFPDLANPRELTWTHKAPLRRAALRSPQEFSHFIYLEDDIGLTYRNFRYFVEFSRPLADRGLIPGFLRTEFRNEAARVVSTDAVHRTALEMKDIIHIRNTRFAQHRFLYQACYVLDRPMALEHLASRSFDIERSREVEPNWGIAPRAAMGVCLENVPDGFLHRYVLPIDEDCSPLPMCWVDHMPANYANQAPDSPCGKVPVEEVFEPIL